MVKTTLETKVNSIHSTLKWVIRKIKIYHNWNILRWIRKSSLLSLKQSHKVVKGFLNCKNTFWKSWKWNECPHFSLCELFSNFQVTQPTPHRVISLAICPLINIYFALIELIMFAFIYLLGCYLTYCPSGWTGSSVRAGLCLSCSQPLPQHGATWAVHTVCKRIVTK